MDEEAGEGVEWTIEGLRGCCAEACCWTCCWDVGFDVDACAVWEARGAGFLAVGPLEGGILFDR